jgi:two-component system, cell cycle sensor histidine kinase and response regulator CckA
MFANVTLATVGMSQKILIVDDETPIRVLLRSTVASPGFEVFDADCGSRALDMAERDGPFDLVVTDVLMPGMDGFELAHELRRAGQATSFLFISGYCDADDMMKRLGEFPAASFLSKPFPVVEFIQAVRRLLPAPVSVSAEAHRRRA